MENCSMSEERTIRDYIIDVYNAYEELKQIIYKVLREPLTIIMNMINDKLNQILDLPYTEENLKLLKDFLDIKHK